jgi:polar amino acid transport system ATP-binding protein
MIRLEEIHKHFGQNHVLQGVSLDVEKGEVVCIVGPSGSGKSTLLRCINHLEVPTSGRIYIDGALAYQGHSRGRLRPHPHRQVAAVRAKVGMVFQQFNLFPHRTALQNVMEGPAHVKGTPRRAAEQLARELLARVGLADKADHYPEELSGGQQQRVAIARALAMEPGVMLFDEATSALDPELVNEVLDVMRKLVVFMDAGQIVEMGRPNEVFNEPTHQRTRDFLQAIARRED